MPTPVADNRPPPGADVFSRYQERKERFQTQQNRLSRQASWVSNARLATFVLAAVGAIWGYQESGSGRLLLWGAAGGCALGYLALVLIHDRVLQRLDRVTFLTQLNQEALARLERRWLDLPLAQPQLPADEITAEANDVDLLGQASLFHLLNTAATPAGGTTLARWLLHPAPPQEIQARQAAVAELAPLLDWRQELAVRGKALSQRQLQLEPFLAWAEGSSWLLSRPLLLWLPRLMGLATLLCVVVHAMGLTQQPYWLVAVAANIVFSSFWAGPCLKVFSQVSTKEHHFRHYAAMFQLFERPPFASRRLNDLQQQLVSDHNSATMEMKRLDTIVGLADVRLSGLLHFFLEALTLWDFHVLWLLERWQQRAGPRARRWIDHLAQTEALAALAGLKHDQPSWVFPGVQAQGTPDLQATGLGHPLLPPQGCVTNDVQVGPPGTFLLVTGSNMSGKSTLLRSLGTNVALAQAGAPVFAQSLTMSPLTLATSFRIRDSLENGVSFFMAELQRIKEIVVAADEHTAPPDDRTDTPEKPRTDTPEKPRTDTPARTLFYLLDEILLGTNVVERQIAVAQVLRHLLQKNAIGAISTHDLSLATLEGLSEACRAVHFTETFREDSDGPEMTFDYRLRQGVAPTVNALKLLRIVGLTEESGS